MEFFNRKEEVLDIQLTQYGKYLLSKGKLRPKYYAFYDGDLTYDSNYGGFNENQVETEDRIKETSRIKALSAFEGAETRMKKITQGEALNNLDIDEKAMLLQQVQPTQTRYYGLGGLLGSSALTSVKAPAWSIRFLEGEMKGSTTNYTGSIRNQLIPQIEIKLETKIEPVSDSTVSDTIELDESLGHADLDTALEEASVQMYAEFEDLSSFRIKNDTAVIEILEFNAPRRNYNFDVEIFKIEEDEKGNEDLILLKFQKFDFVGLKDDLAIQRNNEIAGTILTDEAENKAFSQYFINLSLDGQVERPAVSIDQSPPADPILSNVPVNDFVCPEEVNAFENDESIGSEPSPGSGGGSY
jgi:hypothetical protein